MEDDRTASDREILDLAGVDAVHASRMPTALRTRARGGYPAQFEVHRIVDAEHTLDTRTGKVREAEYGCAGSNLQGEHAIVRVLQSVLRLLDHLHRK